MALISDSKGTGRLQLSMTRIVIVWFFLIATTAVIVSRLLWIQVLHPEKLIAEGNMRVLRSYHYEPPRGLITDRNGRILAISIPVKTVIADPKRLAEEGFYNDPKNIEKVSAILEIKKDVLIKKIENRTKRYALLKNYLDPEKAKALKAISKKGFILEDTYLRRYPTGEANASLVGIINGDGVGVYGVEQSFNSYLTSTKTTNLARKDIYNHIFENIATVKQGTAGGNLILSIDNRLQNYAYQSLKKVVEENEADSGSAVLIDVISGEVLAMVNAPSFDPNNRKTFDSSNAKNRAVTDIFEPGSTMKPIVALSALEAKTTNRSQVLDTRPFIVDGKMVRDSHAMTQGTILDIIKYSSNTGMAHISMRTGPQKILSTLQDFGFGTKTQSGLVGESSGKLNEHRAFWSEIDKATLGFGYGIAVTNLQLSSAYATLANGGLKVPVSILRLSKLPTPTLVASPKQVALMKQALETVVSDGTGGKAAIDRYRVAGKTGTAKIASVGGYGKYYISTFAGFAPLSKPRFALVVNVNAPKAGKFYGGVVSGPVFREVMSRALQLYNIKPDKQL